MIFSARLNYFCGSKIKTRRKKKQSKETKEVRFPRHITMDKIKNPPKVILAHPFNPEKHDISTGWLVSEKLDGVRAYWTGTQLMTRNGNLFTPPEKWLRNFPSYALDGELFMARGKFQETVSIVRSVTQDKGWSKVKFLVFDAPDDETVFEERLKRIPKNSKSIKEVKHVLVNAQADLDRRLDAVLAKGGEGLMLRQPGSLYEMKRSKTLLKVKKMHDAECIVVSHVPGRGKHRGRMGALECEMPDKKRFKIGTGFTDTERENPPEVGARVTYKFQEKTNAGLPRFPVYMRVRDFNE